MRRKGSCDWAVLLVVWGGAFCSGVAWAQDAVSEPDHVIVPQCRSYGFSRTGDFAVAVVGVQAFVTLSHETTAETTLIFQLENKSSTEQSAELLMPAPGGVTLELFPAGVAASVAGRVLSEGEATTLCGEIAVDVNDPALMEFVNTPLFRSGPFLLAPNATATITAGYRQPLALLSNRVDYLLPRTEFIGYRVPWEITVTIDAGNDIKRELTLVLDRSGSMSGVMIEQVKQAAREVIGNLADGEAFNLITYNETIKVFNSEPLLKNASTMQAAFTYLDSISATGMTNLYGALETALMQKPTDGFLPLILFLTDGLPTTGETSEIKIRDLASLVESLQPACLHPGRGV